MGPRIHSHKPIAPSELAAGRVVAIARNKMFDIGSIGNDDDLFRAREAAAHQIVAKGRSQHIDLLALRQAQRSRAYRRRAMTEPDPMTPVVIALSGQRSRISKTQGEGRRDQRAAIQPGITATRGGDVAMTTSGRGACRAAVAADRVKPKKAHIRPV